MYKYLKRFLDFILSIAAIVFFLPLFLILCIIIKKKLGSPIFYKQKRSGMNQKPFNIIKFRTMTNIYDVEGKLLPDENRLTNFGKMLRSTSLDELPELLCIIKGDMSIIGPRPLPIEYDKYFYLEEKKRFKVRGGLIPPDSIDKSPIISWEKQFKYEVEYAENLSFSKDLEILLNSFIIVFKREITRYGCYIRKPLSEERIGINSND